jgi:glycosyltransferase involved in cell wall biosynthesis
MQTTRHDPAHDLEQFHILSFEGPDPYSRAGGIATRITGLIGALSNMGHRTHLWFVGDPDLPDTRRRGCSRCTAGASGSPSPGGRVRRRGGEGRRLRAFAAAVLDGARARACARIWRRAVVLAEEWQTGDAVLQLDALLRRAGLRERVTIFWDANNTFGFERIDWPRLASAATIVTVSRYMKHRMRAHGGRCGGDREGSRAGELPRAGPDRSRGAAPAGERAHAARQGGALDPDKRWLLAIDTAAELKRKGDKPLLVARGGLEAHESEVLARVRGAGLRVVERHTTGPGAQGLLPALADTAAADVVVLRSHLDPAARGVLFRAADAVLANSGHEPFGLVGLEAMAVGGLACTGASGEDYAIDGHNAVVLQQDDPREFVSLWDGIRNHTSRTANYAARVCIPRASTHG